MTGLQRFAATLTERFAGLPPPAVTELADRLTAALRVSVTGRPGVGRRTVAAVLNRAAGIRVTDADAEVRIRVLAEVVKPEDAAALEPQVVAALRGGDAVMVKGSNASGMGRIVKSLARKFGAPQPANVSV